MDSKHIGHLDRDLLPVFGNDPEYIYTTELIHYSFFQGDKKVVAICNEGDFQHFSKSESPQISWRC